MGIREVPHLSTAIDSTIRRRTCYCVYSCIYDCIFGCSFIAPLRKAEGKLTSALGFAPILTRGPYGHELYNPKTGQKIGDITFSYKSKNKTIYVDLVFVDRHYQSLGVSRVLLGSLLDRFPETQTIYLETLSMDNFRVYQKAKEEGDSPLEAIKKTPAYKIREYFGFTEIKVVESTNDDISLTATKP